MNILIIGATGYIGEYVSRKYETLGYTVKATSRRMLEDTIPFDMRCGTFSALSNLFRRNEEKHAILCAAETGLDRCKTYREEAYEMNVIQTKRLLSFLKEQKYHIIFCSTDSVFDGTKGNYTETDDAVPINEYGKMKIEIERYITEQYPECCIVRLSKVIGRPEHKKDMLSEWERDAIEGREIFCIRGNYFSPVYIDDVANCFQLIMEHRLSGIYHICGNRRYERIGLCRDFLRKLGADAKVSEKKLEDFPFYDARPLDTSMSNGKFRSVTNYKFIDLENIFSLYEESVS